MNFGDDIPTLRTTYKLSDSLNNLVCESRITINQLISECAALRGRLQTTEREIERLKSINNNSAGNYKRR